MSQAATPSAEADFPPMRGARYLLFTLTAACLLSFVDRFTLNVLLGSIKSSMRLSDVQVGLLVGFAFSVFYSVMAMPFGWAVDRWNRRNLILIGIILWSAATAACGLATNFHQLLAARIFVGIGEATLMPAAYSMMADAFPPRQRGRAFGIYSMAVYAGGGVALVLGGALLLLAARFIDTMPALSGMEAWHLVFLMIGAVGIPMALLIASTPEPVRRRASIATTGEGASLLRYLAGRWQAFTWTLLVYTLFTYVTFGVLPWAPTLMTRKFGLAPAEAGLTIGLVTLVGGLAGAWAGGAMSDRWITRGTPGGRMRAMLPCWIATAIAIPCFAFAPTVGTAAAGYFGFILANSFGYVSMSATFQDMVPPALRGRTTSFWYLVTYIGAGAGPLTTGLLTDRWFGTDSALPEALVLMSLPVVAISLVCTLIAFPFYDAVRSQMRNVP